jgi:hypothetical protein
VVRKSEHSPNIPSDEIRQHIAKTVFLSQGCSTEWPTSMYQVTIAARSTAAQAAPCVAVAATLLVTQRADHRWLGGQESPGIRYM